MPRPKATRGAKARTRGRADSKGEAAWTAATAGANSKFGKRHFGCPDNSELLCSLWQFYNSNVLWHLASSDIWDIFWPVKCENWSFLEDSTNSNKSSKSVRSSSAWLGQAQYQQLMQQQLLQQQIQQQMLVQQAEMIQWLECFWPWQ